MRRQLSALSSVIPLFAVASCANATSIQTEGVHVEARQDVLLSESPLGDVVVGDLEQGDEVIASCYVARAQSNAGVIGSAIRVMTGDLKAYAAVTDFPEDPSDRQAIFDLDEETLRDRLPDCSS